MLLRLAAVLLALSCWCCHAAPVSQPRQLLLIKTHNPTPAMLERWCTHFANPGPAANHGFEVAIMFYSSSGERGLGDDVVTIPSPWCMPFLVVRKRNLTALWGEAQAEALTSQPWVWCSAPDLAYFALRQDSFPYEHMWVFDQDVAWTGSVFSLLGSLARGRDGSNLLCFDVSWGRVGKKHWWQLHNDNWMWWKTHSDWAGWDDSPGAPRVRCQIMVVRYSTPLLRHLTGEYLAKGRYAHGEWFAASVCGLSMPGCRVSNFADDTTAIGDPFNCCAKPVTTALEWMATRARFRGGAFIHPVKI